MLMIYSAELVRHLPAPRVPLINAQHVDRMTRWNSCRGRRPRNCDAFRAETLGVVHHQSARQRLDCPATKRATWSRVGDVGQPEGSIGTRATARVFTPIAPPSLSRPRALRKNFSTMRHRCPMRRR